MREWLLGLTRPEDHLLWAWVAIAVGYAAVGTTLGLRARRPAVKPSTGAPSPGPAAPRAAAAPEPDSR